MNEIQMRQAPETIITRLNEARHALTVARNDFERIRVCNYARAVEAAAAVLGRREIQVEASVLVQEAERAIAKANPPMDNRAAGARRWKERVVPGDGLIKPSTMRDIRQTHAPIGTQGNFPTPAAEARVSSVIHACREAHSVKPATVSELLKVLYPEHVRIELFARKQREGWSVWGNQS